MNERTTGDAQGQAGRGDTRAADPGSGACAPEAALRGNPTRSREHFRWDGYHHQPHVDLSKWQKLWVGKNDVAAILALVAKGLPHVAAVVRTYRALVAAAPRPEPVGPHQVGVAISPNAADLDRHVGSLAELGVRSALIRIPCWQPGEVLGLRDRLAALHRDGMSFTFALLQDREAVTRPERWRAFATEVAQTLAELEPTFQVGQAPNRKKWGVWHPREYLALLDVVPELRGRFPGCRWIGPSVIDFEYHCTLGFLSAPRPCDFDGVAALLYVDRRGAPDARQYRHFDLWRKLQLLKAVVAASPHPDVPLHLTEFNWPLKGSGRHCPAGAAVATDEERQAAYLVAYYLTALAAGGVERVFWWQLVARGYGLRDEDEGWAPRASYAALRHLAGRVAGGSVQRLEGRAATTRGFVIRRGGAVTVVAYDIGSGRVVDLAGLQVEVRGVDGGPMPATGLRLGFMPTYLEVGAGAETALLEALGLGAGR